MTIQTYTTTFLRQLAEFALDYRWNGRYGCDRGGAFSRVVATARHDGLEARSVEDLLAICRQLAAEGNRAFEC